MQGEVYRGSLIHRHGDVVVDYRDKTILTGSYAVCTGIQ